MSLDATRTTHAVPPALTPNQAGAASAAQFDIAPHGGLREQCHTDTREGSCRLMAGSATLTRGSTRTSFTSAPRRNRQMAASFPSANPTQFGMMQLC